MLRKKFSDVDIISLLFKTNHLLPRNLPFATLKKAIKDSDGPVTRNGIDIPFFYFASPVGVALEALHPGGPVVFTQLLSSWAAVSVGFLPLGHGLVSGYWTSAWSPV